MQNRTLWLFLDSRSIGGIETHVATLATALQTRGYCVVVLFWQRYAQRHPIEQKLSQDGIKVRYLHGRWGNLRRAYRLDQPLIVHTHGYKAGLIGRLLKLVTGVAVVSSFHAGEQPTGKLALYTWMDRFTASLSDRVVAISDEIAGRLQRGQVIRNFVALPERQPCQLDAHQRKTVAFVGRLSHEKGPDRFVELARMLPEVRFAIYGDGPMRAQLASRLPTNVVMHGAVAQMSNHWSTIGLLCMPSRAEGLPMAALEAMSHGVPVMATSVGQLPQLIEHGRNGWLLAGDRTRQWQRQIQQWLALSNRCRYQMAQQCRKMIAGHYSVDAVMPEFERLYQQLRG